MLAGGLGGLGDEKPVNEDVQKIVKGVHKMVEQMAGEEYKSIEPLTYRAQVVAGTNYFIKALATAKNDTKSHIHLRVTEPLKGDLMLIAIKKNQDKQGALEYFQ